jgi:23S rRNA pseudouridine2605 synthase
VSTDGPQRLQKVLAAAGVASRRASEDLITAGRVTVDGRVAQIGDKVEASEVDIRVDGERVTVDPGATYIMLNKPQGVITTVDDPQGRPTVMDLINLQQRLYPVGRLDMDTEGLLLLTNDGELTNRLLHPRYQVERTYLALVPSPFRKGKIAQLREGVELEDGSARAHRVRVVDDHQDHTLLELVMTEGRKREVRRMLDAVGSRCERLARTAYGGVELGDLKQGKWRHLTHHEVTTLQSSVEQGSRPDASRGASRQDRRAREENKRGYR